MEKSQLFITLFNKYLDNCCSMEETEHLFRLIQREEYRWIANEMIENRLKESPTSNQTDTGLIERLNHRLHSILADTTDFTEAPVHRVFPWRIVAAASILIIFFMGVYQWSMRKTNHSDSRFIGEEQVAAASTDYTRFIVLPDSSTVILHSGSKLEYPEGFTGKNREVNLYGEAYFDVSHRPEQPFVIHTGTIKTTVLGTAFNIKYDHEGVTVSVTRGKVRVEDKIKTLAILTPDQQVQYKVKEDTSSLQIVNASDVVTDWTKEEMVFNGITFEEIVKILELRYGVALLFENDSLKKCSIRASFSGTETLEQVLNVLSLLRNGSYERMKDGSILLKGSGCD